VGTLRDAGRRLLFWGALILVLWAAYELFVRVDAMAIPLNMFFRMWVGEKVPFSRAVTYLDWRILKAPGLLALCILLGIIALTTRKRSKMGLLIIPLCILMGFLLVGERGLLAPNIWQTLKLLPLIMMALGVVMWYCMFQSGVHASIAGVIIAFLLPANKMATFETRLNFPVNFFIIPLFALANTSIVVSAASITGLGSPLSLGIILGLFLGKPIGISLAVYLMIKLKLAELGKIKWSQFIGAGILAGIGFTMSIFVSNLAFPQNELYSDIAKLSVLIASGLAMTVGFIWLTSFSKGSPSPPVTAP